MGADVSERTGMPQAGWLAEIYYTLGLFVLGGVDYGTPVNGTPMARGLLWFAYFAAPAVTASALVEGAIRLMDTQAWLLSRLRGHVIIGGCGRVAALYIERFRAVRPNTPLVVVDVNERSPLIDTAVDLHNALAVHGDISNPAVLERLHLDRASSVVLLTDNDFTNLDAAANALQLRGKKGCRVVLHVANLAFLRAIEHTRVARECEIFNTHQIAAEHLVRTEVLSHFQKTEPLDLVVLAGFGRFGQTILDVLQREAAGAFSTVVLVDLAASKGSAVFAEQVGFSPGYDRVVIDGDLEDPTLWRGLDERFDFSTVHPVLVVGSGADGINMRTALWLAGEFPDASVIARSFRRSAFAEDAARQTGVHAFSVADLIRESIPERWLRAHSSNIDKVD